MKVYYNLSDFSPLPNAAVAVGTFDGVHIGHQKILNQLTKAAHKIKGESVLLTFSPHPRMVLQPDAELKLLNAQAEKIELLSNTGLDHLIIHPFTKEFSRTTGLDFVRNMLVNQIGAKKLVIGYDHHFGRNREGSFEHLKEYGPVYGFEVEEIPAQDIDDITVSSTKVRKALGEGDVKTAASYLSYSYPITGKIVSGEGLGKGLGFPTANVLVEDVNKLIPTDGVYAVKCNFPASPEEQFSGMCNIGRRPTFNGKFKTIEVNLFDFNRDIYGEQITLKFIDRIRGEQKFNGQEALVKQLHEDETTARSILRD